MPNFPNNSFATQTIAAFAAVLLAISSIGAVVTVPGVDAASLAVELA